MDAVAIRSIDDYLRALTTSFNPAAAGDRSLVLQYEFTGREQGVYYAAIAAGQIQVGRGPHPSPTVVVKTDFDLWLRVITHDVDGLIAYQDGLYVVEGDFLALMDSDLWFERT
jgi:putative sterol carrier protein